MDFSFSTFHPTLTLKTCYSFESCCHLVNRWACHQVISCEFDGLAIDEVLCIILQFAGFPFEDVMIHCESHGRFAWNTLLYLFKCDRVIQV